LISHYCGQPALFLAILSEFIYLSMHVYAAKLPAAAD